MEELIAAMLRLLAQAGRTAVKAFPEGKMPHLETPTTAVGIREVKSVGKNGFSYLGMRENADGVRTAWYGKPLETELELQIYCPRRLGGRSCMEEAERIAAILADTDGGIQITSFSVGVCSYDAESDCFRCTLTAKTKAYLYAQANAEETEFTDFILKGELK